MIAALYFKWQYTKVYLSQTGKRLLDSDHSLKASSNTPDLSIPLDVNTSKSTSCTLKLFEDLLFLLSALTRNSFHESMLGFVIPSDSCCLLVQIYMFLVFKALEVLPCIGVFAVK